MRQLIAIPFLLVLASASQGAIIGGGAELIDAPDVIGKDSFEFDQLFAFEEKQEYVLQQALKVDGGMLAAGTVVNSHYVLYDPKLKGTLSETITFDGEILAVVSKTRTLRNSDFLGAEGTTYHSFYYRGLEYGRGYDNIFAWPDGHTLTLTLRAKTPGDYLRVLTRPVDDPGPPIEPPPPATPEPTGALLFAAGLALVKLRTGRV